MDRKFGSLLISHAVSAALPARRALTLHPDLLPAAVRAREQGELLRLVHGVVGAGHHHPFARTPAAHVVLQVQHYLVHRVHLEASLGKTWRQR